MNVTKPVKNTRFRLAGGERVVCTVFLILFWILTPCQGQGTMTINFEGPPYLSAPYPQPPGTFVTLASYNQSGMGFWNPYGPEGVSLIGSGVSWAPHNGTAFLATSGGDVGFGFSSGAHFNLVSFDLAEGYFGGPLTIQVVGYKSMGVTVTNAFTTDGINDLTGPLQDFQTFDLDSQFVNVYRVDILTPRWALDNVVISGVPEPSSGALVVLGFCSAIGWSRVRSMQR